MGQLGAPARCLYSKTVLHLAPAFGLRDPLANPGSILAWVS